MLEHIDKGTFGFAEPLYLWLLILPTVLLAIWIWRVLRRHADLRKYSRQRIVPGRERHGVLGDLAFWSCLLVAAALCIVALARPQARVLVDRTGIDIVILQDASASMYVSDVLPNRWQRAQQFLRAFADALTWKDDRVALALFARRAAPQLRLTKDPNSLFFFLDHLGAQSPFSLNDDATWDTNIEEGLYWGLKLVEKDAELFGKNRNVKAFLVISDGQAWSGNVKTALAVARQRNIPVYVVGVGTVAGDLIPEAKGEDGRTPPAKIRGVLDRQSLQEIARAGGGEYFEIGREPDRDIAFKIIADVRHAAPNITSEPRIDEVYWRFLLAAAVFIGLGTLLLNKRAELLWQAAGALVSLALLMLDLRT
jgi:hypothetical protein